jgi:hypothetical protein
VSGASGKAGDHRCASPQNATLDTDFENYVDVVGFFTSTDTLEFVFDINGNGLQIS